MALNLKEDVIAGCLAAKYAVRVELQMIEFAIINKMIVFLKNVFVHGKQPEVSMAARGQGTFKGMTTMGDDALSCKSSNVFNTTN
jgi:hypothetical protein